MKKPKPFTAVHAIGFIYNAFAHVTDGEQVAEEISAVVESLADFNCSKEQIAEIYDWYCDVFAEGEEEMQKTLHTCLSIVERTFKENDPQKIVAKGFIDNLVDIAKADGVIKDSEKAWLTNFCKILDIEEPNILEENNEPDISTDDIIKGLELLQHRGQQSAGIIAYNNNTLLKKKELGLVKDIFNNYEKSNSFFNIGIGHVRYTTSRYKNNNNNVDEIQPQIGVFNNKKFILCFNGNIPQLNKYIKKFNLKDVTNDTSFLIKYIENSGVNKFEKAVKKDKDPILHLSEKSAEEQVYRLNMMKKTRNQDIVKESLNNLRDASKTSSNLIPYIIDAVKSNATLGEISDILRSTFGIHS